MPRKQVPGKRSRTVFGSLRALAARRKDELTNEILEVRGLMPLLMKPRNKEHWTPEDRAQLALCLKALSRSRSYMTILTMPGGLFALPALAWWLDRRRNRSGMGTSAGS
jgi:hypothetical protein